MLDAVTAFAIGIAPWALGAAMLYGLFYQPKRWRLEHHLFIIGSAAYMGYLWVALLMAGLQRYSVPVFSDWLLAWMVLSIVVCWGMGTLVRLRSSKHSMTAQSQTSNSLTAQQGPWWLIAGMSLWLIVMTASVFWEVAFRPAVAWDTLTFWADQGRGFLRGQFNERLNAMSSRTHPVTIKYVGAWGAFALYERSTIGLYWPWATLYLGLIFVCAALGKLLSGLWWLGLIAAIALTSSPLIHAQASLGGYADLWLGAGLFLCLAWLAVAQRGAFQPKAAMVILVSLLIISLAFLKGNAVAYSMVLLGAMLFTWAWMKWHWAAVLGLIVAGILGVLWVWNNGVDWSFADYRLTFLPEEGRIALGQRQARLASNSWIEIGRNFWHAWGLSSSFYLAALSGLIACIFAAFKQTLRADFSFLTGLVSLIALLIFFGLGQHLNEHQLFAHATPDSDTGLSRFSQIVYFSAVFAFVSFISMLLAATDGIPPRRLCDLDGNRSLRSRLASSTP